MRSTSIVAALAALSLAVAPASASATNTVLGFEDIGSDFGCCAWVTSYGGLTWSGFYTISRSYHAGSGYDLGSTGSRSIFMQGSGTPNTVTSATPFDFAGADFAAAWDETATLTLQGFRAGSLVGSTVARITSTGPTWVTANFLGIDELRLSGDGNQVNIDSFTLGSVSPTVTATPEPASIALLGGGLLALGAAARRRRSA